MAFQKQKDFSLPVTQIRTLVYNNYTPESPVRIMVKPTCGEDVTDNPLARPALPFSHCICTGLPRDHLFQRTLTHESSFPALIYGTWANISPCNKCCLYFRGEEPAVYCRTHFLEGDAKPRICPDTLQHGLSTRQISLPVIVGCFSRVQSTLCHIPA